MRGVASHPTTGHPDHVAGSATQRPDDLDDYTPRPDYSAAVCAYFSERDGPDPYATARDGPDP